MEIPLKLYHSQVYMRNWMQNQWIKDYVNPTKIVFLLLFLQLWICNDFIATYISINNKTTTFIQFQQFFTTLYLIRIVRDHRIRIYNERSECCRQTDSKIVLKSMILVPIPKLVRHGKTLNKKRVRII